MPSEKISAADFKRMVATVIHGTEAINRWIPFHEIDPGAMRELDLMGESIVVLAEVTCMMAKGAQQVAGMETIKNGVGYMAQAAYQLGYRKAQDDGSHREE